MTETFKVYKLRRKSDGLYSTGGTDPNFVACKGKEWKNIGHLKNHLVMFSSNRYYGGPHSNHKKTQFDNLEIVEYEGIRTEKSVQSVADYVDGLRQRSKKNQLVRCRRKAESAVERAEKELEQARSKLNNLENR
ncbi:MAG: hypothetical protein KGL39_00640 [Patescibacteria group bacterium]|nr:hypothetical protein [Patescibacteria group bacterium]